MKIRTKLVLTIGLVLSTVSHSVFASTYQLTNLGTLGGRGSFASDINDKGVVVGTTYDSANQLTAFVYDGALKPLTSETRQVFAINNAGQIVGRTNGDAFLYDNGVLTLIDADSAYDINEQGQIVGYVRASTNYAFLYENGVLTDLGMLPNSSVSSARSINDLGVIVGNSSGTPFIYENGQMQALDYFNGAFSLVSNINNNNQIIGYYKNIDGKWDAYMIENGVLTSLDFNGANTFPADGNDFGMIVGSYQSGASSFDASAVMYDQNGTFIDLNTLATYGDTFDLLKSASGINNLGQIVGVGLVDGNERAFLLTPDEPLTTGCLKYHKKKEDKVKEKKCNGNRAR